VRIDIHAHLWTDEYLDMLQAFGKEDTAAQRDKGARRSQRQEHLNDGGAQTSVGSIETRFGGFF
jgi:hypothetical protein